MNLSDIPAWVPFWGVVSLTFGLSLLLFLLFRFLPKPPISEEEGQLEKEIQTFSKPEEARNLLRYQFESLRRNRFPLPSPSVQENVENESTTITIPSFEKPET